MAGPLRAAAGATGVLCGLAWLLASANAAASDTPMCLVETRLPERGWVGEQLPWELRITRRRDVDDVVWDAPLEFPGFRAEWLPGGRAEAAASGHEGYVVTTERRALFPAHEGTLPIPDAALLCRAGELEERVVVPGGPVRALTPPQDARPEAWDGLVGPVAIELRVAPERAAVGANLRLALMLRGTGNLWHVGDLLGDALADAAVDVFPGRPELARDAGQRLSWRRYLSYDLVPRAAGSLTVPAFELVTFDPETARYVRVATEPRRIEVAAAGAPGVPGEMPASAPGGGPSETLPSPGTREPAPDAAVEDEPGYAWLAWSGALVALAGLAAWLVVRRRRRAPLEGEAQAPTPADAVRAALDDAADGEEAGDEEAALAALARGLRAALADALPGAGTRSTEELLGDATEPGTRGLVELLVRVERLRYDADAAPAERRALVAELAALLPPGQRPSATAGREASGRDSSGRDSSGRDSSGRDPGARRR